MAPAVNDAGSVAARRRCVRDGRGLVFPRGKIRLNITHFVVPLIVRWRPWLGRVSRVFPIGAAHFVPRLILI